MKNNKIGFNNFKGFGEKEQVFSEKPITLLYGPNSIGKSSCLHFLLYVEYLKQTGNIDLQSSDFAGDNIDLGGFYNFIHKKSKKRNIKYQLILNKPSDIDKYFSSAYTKIKKFELDGAFLQKELNITDIENRVNSYRIINSSVIYIPKADRIVLKSFLKYPQLSKHEEIIRDEMQTFSFVHKDILPDRLEDHFKIFQSCVMSNDTLDNVLIKKDNKPFDAIDKLMIYIMEVKNLSIFSEDVDNDERIYAIWLSYKLFNAIRYINSIRFVIQLHFDNMDAAYTIDYYIDNHHIYNYTSTSNSFHEYTSDLTNIIKESESIMNKSRGLQYVLENHMDLLDPTTTSLMFPEFREQHLIPTDMFIFGNQYSKFIKSLNNRVIYSLLHESKTRPSQYLGPIRFVPQRCDMKQQKSNHLHANRTDDSNMKSVFLTPWIINDNIIPRKVRIWLYWRFWIYALRQLKSNIEVSDSWNNFLEMKNKLSSGDAMNSEKMWLNFANSPDIQRKVNQWLSDDVKLKTPYSIHVEEIKKHKYFGQLFNRMPLTYYHLTFFDKRTETHVTPQEMGLGISQVLPILISAFTLTSHKIFIEQPELHLHPAVQCEIADEIIRSFKTNDNQFVIETHSEHLLLRIMKRLRHTAQGIIDADDELALTPDDVCLLYVDNNGKTTFINELELDSDGTLLDPWPNGFFEEDYHERFD